MRSAGDGLELGAELGRVVGDEFGPVAGPAYFDVEALCVVRCLCRASIAAITLSTVRPWKA